MTGDLRLKTQLLGTTRWRRSCSCRGGGTGGRVVAVKARGGQYSGACASPPLGLSRFSSGAARWRGGRRRSQHPLLLFFCVTQYPSPDENNNRYLCINLMGVLHQGNGPHILDFACAAKSRGVKVFCNSFLGLEQSFMIIQCLGQRISVTSNFVFSKRDGSGYQNG